MRTSPTSTCTPRGFSKKPVPTKFRPDEERILEDARTATGYSQAELIRRSVRLMGRQKETFSNYGFLLQLTA
jgi:hypothetical protein